MKLMNKLCHIVCCFLLMLGVAFAGGPASYEPPPEKAWNDHTGFFIEGGVGFNGFYAFLPNNRSTASLIGYSVPIAAGYNFLQHVAIEGGFIYSSELNAAVQDTILGVSFSAAATARLYIPYLALRFLVPVGQRINIVFKLGGMYPFADVRVQGIAAGITNTGRISGNHLLPFSGIGATYAVTPKLDINLMYQGAVYVLASGAALSLGLTYHFS